MDTKVAWTRWCITRGVWALAAGLAGVWRSELIGIIEHCTSASLPARLSIYGSVYVVLAGLAVPSATSYKWRSWSYDWSLNSQAVNQTPAVAPPQKRAEFGSGSVPNE